MYKRIVRNMTFGEPVVIAPPPKPLIKEPEPEVEPEPEPEPEPAIPKEILDKIFAEIEEIEQKSKLTDETLAEAQKIREEAEEFNRQAEKTQAQAEQIKKQAKKIRDDARAESEQIIADAHAEADKLVADTKQEAEELLARVQKEGYDTGYKDGRKQGIEDGKSKIEKDLAEVIREANDKAQKTIRDAKEQTSEYFIRAEDEIVGVVMMAIEKILPQHFLDVPQVILPIVREAISHVRDQREVKIHVEPESYDLILMARSEFQSMLTDGTAIIEVISDDALKPGDCVIETPNGGVDARLSTQLDLMKKAVQSVMNKQEANYRV